MKKMKKLDLSRIDLDELCHALEDHAGETSWWLDPKTGKLHMRLGSMWDGENVGEDFEPPEGSFAMRAWSAVTTASLVGTSEFSSADTSALAAQSA